MQANGNENVHRESVRDVNGRDVSVRRANGCGVDVRVRGVNGRGVNGRGGDCALNRGDGYGLVCGGEPAHDRGHEPYDYRLFYRHIVASAAIAGFRQSR